MNNVYPQNQADSHELIQSRQGWSVASLRVAFLLEDPRLKVFGHSEKQALKEIQALHRDVLEANRFIDRKEVTE